MAIYHLTASVISRARGQSVTAAAAYRSASALYDERYGITHNYCRRGGIAHSQIMAPLGAPGWVGDRQTLWNRVEAREQRKDSQLARAVDISLPQELSEIERVALVRDYVTQEFVSQGMIADLNIHQNPAGHPQVHVLLTLRPAEASGFGPKARHWNRKSNLLDWRAAWAERANHHLARAGHPARIDHRSLDAQQSELAPTRNLGVGHPNPADGSLPAHLLERLAEQRRIRAENGATMIADAGAALRALTRQRAIFTRAELTEFLRPRTSDEAQFEAALQAVLASSELIELYSANGDPERFTSKDLLEAEKSLMKRVAAMSTRRGHGAAGTVEPSPWQAAFEYTLAPGDLKALAAAPGGADALFSAARASWQAHGMQVQGLTLSKRTAERMQLATGIPFQTLNFQEQEWQASGAGPAPAQVLVVGDAEMIGLKQLERLVGAADKARAKMVLLGDLQQLRAMRSASPLQGIIDQAGLIIDDALPD